MSNVMRWRYGDTNPVQLPVASDTVIEIGDLVAIIDSAAVPASAIEDVGTEAGNQEAFHDTFAGVAMQASAVGETDPIRVATTGVFEFDCASAIRLVGELVGVDENGGGDGLLDQTLDDVATANLAVGRVAKANPIASTKVLVEIVSTLMLGGPQAAA